ncbi:MAG TPA: hypothetical protein VI758_11215 [Bacteroidota bacterium]
MARTKFMMHDCAYCHKQTKMERIGEMPASSPEGEPLKVWYRCTRCKHSALVTVAPVSKDKHETAAKIDRSTCTEYAKDKVYTVGQAIYHMDWDDVGTVLKKETTSNGIHSILVSFEKNGERKLIENIVPEPLEELNPQPISQVS